MGRAGLVGLGLLCAGLAQAQTDGAATEPAPQRIEIVGARNSATTDAREREAASAAKIVVGREEIDRFGDRSLGEVLRRLPGVTVPGAPGSGGAPRLRGLGAGFTQILLDGQRLPPGFAIDSLSPEQVERIEILRAPTAETGAQAIAGTINIVSRELVRRPLNDVKLGVTLEGGEASPNLNWMRNLGWGDWNGQVTAALSFNQRHTRSLNELEITGAGAQVRSEVAETSDRRQVLHLMSRLQWKDPDDPQRNLVLTPTWFGVSSRSQDRVSVQNWSGCTGSCYDLANTEGEGGFQSGRLGWQFRQRLGDWRQEWGGHVSQWNWHQARQRLDTAAGTLLRTVDDRVDMSQSGLALSTKWSRPWSTADGGEGGWWAGEHSLVWGAEWEGNDRQEARRLAQDGVAQLTEFGDSLGAQSQRAAWFIQDEWNPSKQWAFNTGLRWEGLRTVGEDIGGVQPRNLSSVWTPLLHAVYKPNPDKRDQIRTSLTRSYRSPNLSSLIARPTLSTNYPASGANIASEPDRAGNPDLKAEIASGIDIAFERYLPQGGVLSANVFARRIDNTLRRVTPTTPETVSWSSSPRYVSRMQNVGLSHTVGLELEAKFRLDQWLAEAPKMDLRANVGLFRSWLAALPGPDNRIEAQPDATVNLGADYRVPGWPLQVGAGLNWVPGYDTRVALDQWSRLGTKRVWDAYLRWDLHATRSLRLSASNLAPLDAFSSSTFQSATGRSTERTVAVGQVQWQLRLDVKL